jgi:hypothetical protein
LRIATPHEGQQREFAFVALKRVPYPLGCCPIRDHREHIQAPRSMELRHKRSRSVMACRASIWAAARLKCQARYFRSKRRYFSEQGRRRYWLRSLTKDCCFRVVANPPTDISQLCCERRVTLGCRQQIVHNHSGHNSDDDRRAARHARLEHVTRIVDLPDRKQRHRVAREDGRIGTIAVEQS